MMRSPLELFFFRWELVSVSLNCAGERLKETGSAVGSVIGGRWSDYIMTKMKNENEGRWYPEVGILFSK